ncbi:MAG: DUF2206 domain-containing protein [Nitrososphaerota archaeon]
MAGVSHPLSAVPLLIVLNNIILALALIAYLKGNFSSMPQFSFGLIKWSAPLSLPLILSVAGTMFVNVYADNRLLLLMILTISLFAAFLTLKGKVPSTMFAFAVFIIGISLLYHSSLISNYLCSFGSDIAPEYYTFKHTQMNGYWNSTSPAYWGSGFGRLNSMLSITVLPTIYVSLLNLDPAWILKVVFPSIFAFVPLCLYLLWREVFGDKNAFIAAFFFMATFVFYTEMLGLNRQMIGELFFALLLFVSLGKNIGSFQKLFSFTIFSFGLVVSHYALAEIFLFFIVFAWICLFILKRRSNCLTANMVVLFFVMMFVWYIFTSNASVFESFLEFADNIYRQLGDFFNLESRGEMVLRGLGLGTPPTVWNAIGRFFAYATEFLIVIGFIALLLKQRKVNNNWVNFLLTSEAMVFLIAIIIVPGLASTMNVTRFYHVLLFLLAPLYVIGGEFLVRLFKKERTRMVTVLLLSVLVPYFLFQSGFVYEVVKAESWSVSLSMYRMSGYRLYYSIGYTDYWNVFSATWLSRNVDDQRARVYADWASFENTLRIYGRVYAGYIYPLSNVTILSDKGLVYLNSLNTLQGTVVTGTYLCNSSELSFLNDINHVYSNGGSEIYKNAP